jgi:ATP-dependent DNA helicase RecG
MWYELQVKTSVLSDHERDEICSREEDQFFDRKSRLIAPAKISKPFSAFANTDGGELAVGIEDDGTWDGFPRVEAANDLVHAASTTLAPGYFEIEVLRHPSETGLVLLFTIRRSPGVRVTPAGEACVRRGASSAVLRGTDLEDLRRAKGVISYENQGLIYPVIEITNSEKTLEFCMTAIPTTEPEEFLRKQGLINSDGRPTVSGTLLFHEEPQIHLPKSSVKIYRYKTGGEAERKHLDRVPETIEGSLYDQIKDAVTRTTEIVDSIPMLTGEGMRQVHYPPETLHEILTMPSFTEITGLMMTFT